MSQLRKLLERIRNNPRTVRFDELDKLLQNAGYKVRQPRGGSSHYVYRKAEQPPLVVPRKAPFIKPEYVEQAIAALEEGANEAP